MAVLGGSDPADAERLVARLAAAGLAVTAADAMTADLVVLLHDTGATALDAAFADLTRLASRTAPPSALVAAGHDTPYTAGVAALVQTAAVEWAATWKCVNVAGDGDLVAATAAELAHGGRDREVRVEPSGGRAIRTRIDAPIAGPMRPLDVGPWIISGGARGVTAVCGLALARAGARRIVLLGRTPLDDEPASCRGARDEAAIKKALVAEAGAKPDLRAIGRTAQGILAQREIRATLAGLQAAGAEVRYEAADVADADAVRRVVAEVRAAWGPIGGIIHGAGVLADKRLGDKTAAQFASVLQPKLDGVRALLDACASDPLRFLCFFSSVAAHGGNAGQADYAAANAVLDRLAVDEQQRRGDACHVVSIAWGPWAGGMVTETLAKHFTARGISLIPQDAGAQMLVRELQGGRHAQVVVGSGIEQLRDDAPVRLRYDVRQLPELCDHAIGGAVVLPMTMAVDALLGAGRRVLGADCELRDLQLLNGLRFDGDAGELDLVSDVSPAGDAVTATLRHLNGRPAYRARVVRTGSEPPPATLPLPATSGDLAAACRAPYADALFHGPAFHVIRDVVRCDDDGIAARLGTAASMGWASRWQIDPAALDGALQLLRVWGVAQDGRPSLPTALGRVRAWAPWPSSGDVGCVVACRRDNAHRLGGEVRFVDLATGAPLLSLDGLVMHVQAS